MTSGVRMRAVDHRRDADDDESALGDALRRVRTADVILKAEPASPRVRAWYEADLRAAVAAVASCGDAVATASARDVLTRWTVTPRLGDVTIDP